MSQTSTILTNPSNLPDPTYAMLAKGSIITGSYTNEGKMLEPAKFVGTEADIAKQRVSVEALGRVPGAVTSRSTDTPAPIAGTPNVEPKKKRGRPKKENLSTVSHTPAPVTHAPLDIVSMSHIPEQPTPRIPIQLQSQMGKVKMFVEAVLTTEFAYCLVFSKEDDITFIPNTGEVLNFVNTDGSTEEIYFPGTIFNWMDGTKRLMLIFKNVS